MRFAVALPVWGYALAFAGALVLAWAAYRRVSAQVTASQRAALTSLRALTLLAIVVCLLRPVMFVQAAGARDSLVAILVDVSRSMRLADAGGPRIEQARAIVRDLQPRVAADFRTELLTFGEALGRGEPGTLTADARRSDLGGALAALVDRYKAQRLAGVIVISDGADTSTEEAGASRPLDVPVFTVGVGTASGARDREIVNLTAGEGLLSGSSVDLSVSLTSTGFGTTPIQVRLTENGRPMETRHVTPSANGAPVHEVFTVSPSADSPTVYSVEIPVDNGELAAENNTRRVLVPPQGRKRRVLVVEGAPGFEHTFLKRALARDPALEIDSVVRKGQNEDGRATFFIQAASSRSAALAGGYPSKAAELFLYDAILFGNVAGDFFSHDQLQITADFVAKRGGGLLVLGARSFDRAGLVGTALEEVLPLDMTDRRGGTSSQSSGQKTLALSADGAVHPATRLAVGADENRKRWAALPPLASVIAAGSPRPGAQVLVTGPSAGAVRPLVVTQRYGLGRSMVFAGEASWRWRMLLPATDTTHELVWRQLTRWLSSGSTDPVDIPPASVPIPGITESVAVLARDGEFTPVANAEVVVRVKEPGGQERSVPAALADPREGRYTAAVRFDQPGVYTMTAEARRGSQVLGTATRPMLVGGSDLEMSEPRLHEDVLRRLAESTGGRYVAASSAADLPGLLRESEVGNPPMEMRDLWHTGWSVALIVTLLAVEWALRRRVGLA